MPGDSPPADFCLVCNKIMLENPHTFLMKTGSYFDKSQAKGTTAAEHYPKVYSKFQTAAPQKKIKIAGYVQL